MTVLQVLTSASEKELRNAFTEQDAACLWKAFRLTPLSHEFRWMYTLIGALEFFLCLERITDVINSPPLPKYQWSGQICSQSFLSQYFLKKNKAIRHAILDIGRISEGRWWSGSLAKGVRFKYICVDACLSWTSTERPGRALELGPYWRYP
jgi:hypothetical protein